MSYETATDRVFGVTEILRTILGLVLTIITILIKHQFAQSCKLNQFDYDEQLPSPGFYELQT